MKENKRLWLRLGDNAEYEDYGSIEEIKELFEELELTKDFRRRPSYGVANTEYRSLNYISLYWGDEEAQPIKPISDKAIEFINQKKGV